MEAFDAQVFVSVQEAINAASAASMGKGAAYPGLLYRQGGRRFVSATLPCADIVELVSKAKPAPKKLHTYNVDVERNRPLDQNHVRAIRDYLLRENAYVLPPILLNSVEPMQIFIYDPMHLFTREGVSACAPCWFVLPKKYRLHTTDGQHRIEGLRQAMDASEDGKFYRDGVAVSIVEELSLDKTHQDFYDAAQVKPLPAAMLVEYDQREPVNRLTRELVRDVDIFRDRTLRAGHSIGKNSPMMFTNNMIRRCVVMMVSGHDSKDAVAASAIQAQPEMWRKRLVQVLSVFAADNPQWRLVGDKPSDTGEASPLPGLREKYVHFLAGGLMVIGGVGHAVLQRCTAYQEALSAEQVAYVSRLAREVDWSKGAPIWARSIVSEGAHGQKNITASRAFLSVAVADAKRAIGLDLTEDERTVVRQAEQGELRRKK